MEGDPVDTWTTVDRKVSKKKPKSEESGSVADEGWSQVGKDRRKKDSVGPAGRSGQDRGERRGDRGDRRGDRGRPPAGGRGGSNQRGTLPRKYPPREGGGAGNARSQRNTPSPAPTANTTWEIKPGNADKAKTSEDNNAPRKSSWASLVNKPPGPQDALASVPADLTPRANVIKESKTETAKPVELKVETQLNSVDISKATNEIESKDAPLKAVGTNSSVEVNQSIPELPKPVDSNVDVPDLVPIDVNSSIDVKPNPTDAIQKPTNLNSELCSKSTTSQNGDKTAETNLCASTPVDVPVLDQDSSVANVKNVIVNSDSNGNSLPLDTNKNTTSSESEDKKETVNSIDGAETRHYDRDVLLQLQRHPLSLQKPDKLPELEIVLSNPMRSSSSAPLLGDLSSQYVHTFSRPPPVKRDSRRKESKKIISLSREPVKLHKAENAWQPSPKNPDEQVNELDNLCKEVRAILNKLTPQNFGKLVHKFKLLVIDTEKKLVNCMELVYEKAVDEPSFSSAYASMCKELSMKKVQQENSEEPVNFIKILIRRCQKEFLADYISDEQRKKFDEDLAKAESDDDKKRVESEFQMLEQKMRRRSLGNIRFISELYNLQMLQGQIMFAIIGKLVKAVDEESLECLCRLLTTSGARIEKEIHKTVNEVTFAGYFDAIQTIVQEKKTSSRVRFLLIDVVDLRKNNWVSRRKEAGPKTIDQIHKEAQLEALRIQLADQRPDAPVARRSEERSRRKTEYRVKPISDGEWSNVPSKAAKISDVVDPEKLRMIKKVDTDNIKLGPSGQRSSFSSWGTGSGIKTAEILTNRNRFEMLEDDEAAVATPVYAGRASEPVRSALDRSASRGRTRPTKTVSQASSREPSVSVRSRVSLRGDSDMDEDKMRMKYTTLLDEYILNCDFEETLASICALVPAKFAETMIEETFNHGMEKKDKEHRYRCGGLLSGLLGKDCLTLDQLAAGLGRLLEIASDIIIDIPRFWDYTADILSRILLQSDCGEVVLEKCCSFVEEGMQKIFIKSNLLAVKNVSGEKLKSILLKKEVLEKLVGQDLDKFIQENDLQVADSETNPSNPEPLMNGNLQEELYRKITHILDKRITGNDEMSRIDIILCDKPMVNETVRTLVTAVIESVVDGLGGPSVSCSLNKDVFLARVPILKRYLDANKDRELSALFAIQSLVHKLEHPNKLLHNILEVLYDKDCISEDALLDWEKNEEPEEQEGKGVALKSCTQFFEWLKTAEEEDEGQVV